MDDFNGLAASMAAGLTDARGCLILSRDGLVLGVHPEADEAQIKPAWIRLAGLGDVERGFLQYGTETYCYLRRGPYAAFVITGPGARPGLTIDQMEQALLAADEARTRRDGVRPAEPAAASTPAQGPRTTLHPEPRSDDEPVVIHAEVAPSVAAAPQGVSAADAAAPSPSADTPPASGDLGSPESSEPSEPPATPDRKPSSTPWGNDDDEAGVDRFSLAREFSQLLQDDENGADG